MNKATIKYCTECKNLLWVYHTVHEITQIESTHVTVRDNSYYEECTGVIESIYSDQSPTAECPYCNIYVPSIIISKDALLYLQDKYKNVNGICLSQSAIDIKSLINNKEPLELSALKQMIVKQGLLTGE
jgi:hypothetical protein